MTEQLGDFTLLESKEFPHMMFTVYVYEHKIFKSKFIYIKTKDRQNTFSATFTTIPCDDRGESHILEHLILDGSEKYPIPQIFDELRKRSYATYMNAATAPEQTFYPFSNISEVDFLNNMDVYLDCIFHPQLTHDDFLQECHHIYFEDDDPSKKLIHGGVIYNEMLGSISNPFMMNNWNVRKNVFPDSTSRFLSGGNPPDVAKATIEDIRGHYAKFYHPSNAMFYLYGSIDPKLVFEKVSETIKDFDDVKTVIDRSKCHQKSWKEPKSVKIEGPCPQNEKPEDAHGVNVCWKVGKSSDFVKGDILSILARYFFLTDKGPLQRALIETGLAKLVHAHYTSSLYDATFEIEVRGVREANVELVSKTILEVVEKTLTEELDRDMLDSILAGNAREALLPSKNMGLRYLSALNRYCMLGRSPFEVIDLRARVRETRRLIEEEGALQSVGRRWLLENPHRLISHLVPIEDFYEKEKAKAEAELAEIKAALTQSEIENIIETHKRVNKNIATPRPTELLPRITKSDIPREAAFTEPTLKTKDVTFFKQPTNGLVKVEVIGYAKIDHAQLDLASIMFDIAKSVGAGDRDEFQLQEFITRYMTHLPLDGREVERIPGTEDERLKVCTIGIALEEDIDRVLEVFKDTIMRPRFDSPERVKIEISKYAHQVRLLAGQSAHYYAGCVASAAQRHEKAAEEAINGLHGDKRVLAFVESHSVEEVIELCKKLFREIVQQATFKAFVNGGEVSESSVEKIQSFLDEVNSMPKVEYERADIPGVVMEEYRKRAGTFLQFDVTTGFSYLGLQAPRRRETDSAYVRHLGKLLKNEFLWREIREKLGAYGAFASYSAGVGLMQLSSYRDTRNKESLEAMLGALKDVADGKVTQAMIDNAAIQVLAAIDAPSSPLEEGVSHAMRGITREEAQANRDKYFTATPEDISRAARILLENSPYPVISTSQKICECPEGYIVDTL